MSFMALLDCTSNRAMPGKPTGKKEWPECEGVGAVAEFVLKTIIALLPVSASFHWQVRVHGRCYLVIAYQPRARPKTGTTRHKDALRSFSSLHLALLRKPGRDAGY